MTDLSLYFIKAEAKSVAFDDGCFVSNVTSSFEFKNNQELLAWKENESSQAFCETPARIMAMALHYRDLASKRKQVSAIKAIYEKTRKKLVGSSCIVPKWDTLVEYWMLRSDGVLCRRQNDGTAGKPLLVAEYYPSILKKIQSLRSTSPTESVYTSLSSASKDELLNHFYFHIEAFQRLPPELLGPLPRSTSTTPVATRTGTARTKSNEATASPAFQTPVPSSYTPVIQTPLGSVNTIGATPRALRKLRLAQLREEIAHQQAEEQRKAREHGDKLAEERSLILEERQERYDSKTEKINSHLSNRDKALGDLALAMDQVEVEAEQQNSDGQPLATQYKPSPNAQLDAVAVSSTTPFARCGNVLFPVMEANEEEDDDEVTERDDEQSEQGSEQESTEDYDEKNKKGTKEVIDMIKQLDEEAEQGSEQESTKDFGEKNKKGTKEVIDMIKQLDEEAEQAPKEFEAHEATLGTEDSLIDVNISPISVAKKSVLIEDSPPAKSGSGTVLDIARTANESSVCDSLKIGGTLMIPMDYKDGLLQEKHSQVHAKNIGNAINASQEREIWTKNPLDSSASDKTNTNQETLQESTQLRVGWADDAKHPSKASASAANSKTNKKTTECCTPELVVPSDSTKHPTQASASAGNSEKTQRLGLSSDDTKAALLVLSLKGATVIQQETLYYEKNATMEDLAADPKENKISKVATNVVATASKKKGTTAFCASGASKKKAKSAPPASSASKKKVTTANPAPSASKKKVTTEPLAPTVGRRSTRIAKLNAKHSGN